RDSVVQRYEREGLLDDDLVRMVSTGIPSEVLVGCAMTQRAGTTWAEHCFRDWGQLDGYRVRDTVWFQRLVDNTRRAVDAVEAAVPGHYPFCCMAFRGAVDMAEAVMGGPALCAAVLDHPRRLKDLLSRITDIIIEVAVAHGDLLPRHRGGQFNSYGIWTPGRTVTFTLDGGCLFSPACYQDFFLPCDQRLCAAFDTPFVHLHAASRQHLPAWTGIANLGLQCVIDQAWLPEGVNRPIGPQLEDLLADFGAIRRRKSLMLYGYWDPSLLDCALAQLPPGGSAITALVEDPDAMRQQYLRRPAPFEPSDFRRAPAGCNLLPEESDP
ncbi:MAG: hypothetical protein ABIL09_13265, partial [Gemmatimonadota bacterium]